MGTQITHKNLTTHYTHMGNKQSQKKRDLQALNTPPTSSNIIYSPITELETLRSAQQNLSTLSLNTNSSSQTTSQISTLSEKEEHLVCQYKPGQLFQTSFNSINT